MPTHERISVPFRDELNHNAYRRVIPDAISSVPFRDKDKLSVYSVELALTYADGPARKSVEGVAADGAAADIAQCAVQVYGLGGGHYY